MTKRAQNTAAVKRTVSASTEALITAKCKVSDLSSDICDAMDLIYGSLDDKQYDEVWEKLRPVNDLIDKYIIESMNNAMASLSSTEF